MGKGKGKKAIGQDLFILGTIRKHYRYEEGHFGFFVTGTGQLSTISGLALSRPTFVGSSNNCLYVPGRPRKPTRRMEGVVA